MKVSENGALVCKLITAPPHEASRLDSRPPHSAGVRTRLPAARGGSPKATAAEPRAGRSGRRSPDSDSRCDLGERFSRRLWCGCPVVPLLDFKKRIRWSHKLGSLNWARTRPGNAPAALGPGRGLRGCLHTGAGWKGRGWPGLHGPGAFRKTGLHLKARIAHPRTTCAPLALCPQRPAHTRAEQTLEAGAFILPDQAELSFPPSGCLLPALGAGSHRAVRTGPRLPHLLPGAPAHRPGPARPSSCRVCKHKTTQAHPGAEGCRCIAKVCFWPSSVTRAFVTISFLFAHRRKELQGLLPSSRVFLEMFPSRLDLLSKSGDPEA